MNSHDPVNVISVHDGDINAVAFSSQYLASASSDKTIRLFNVYSWEQVPHSPLTGHTFFIMALAFNSDESVLGSAAMDGLVMLWDPCTGECLSKLRHSNNQGMRCIAFSPFKSVVMAGACDGTVTFWETAGSQPRTFTAHTGDSDTVTTVDFAPDNAIVISASTNGDLKLFQPSGLCVARLKYVHELGVTCAKFKPATADIVPPNGQAAEKDRSGVSAADVPASSDPPAAGSPMRRTPDRRYTIVTGGNDNNLKVWMVVHSPESTLCNPYSTLAGHSSPPQSLAFHPNGSIVASGGVDMTVMLWSLETMACTQRLEGHSLIIHALQFSGSGMILASAGMDRKINLWLIDDGLDRAMPPPDYLSLVYWSKDHVVAWLTQQCDCRDVVDKLTGLNGRQLLTMSDSELRNRVDEVAVEVVSRLVISLGKLRSTQTDKVLPDHLTCPITQELMRDPVILSDGYTYERAAIQNWLDKGRFSSPITNERLVSILLIPNRSVKTLVLEYRASQLG